MENGIGEALFIKGETYRVLRLLGHGKGGYSYLVEGRLGRFVLKAIHHEPCDYYSFGNKIESEERDYHRLVEAGVPVPKLLYLDKEREWILKEYVDGHTVFDLVKEGRCGEDVIALARTIAENAKDHGLNIDYFPTNFIYRDGTLVYVDYECNAYMQEWDFDHWGVKYWSRTKEFEDYLAHH